VWEACRRNSVGFECALAIDIAPEAMRVFHQNFPGSTVLTADVQSIVDGDLGSKPTSSETRLIKHLGHIDILLSGSPCQGFSPLNNHTRGKDRRNSLYLRATRLLELMQPENAIFENVPNVVNSQPNVVALSKDIMTRLGYEVDEKVLDLSQIGVPQLRKRHVLVGSKTEKISIESTVKKYLTSRKRSVKWAVGDLESSLQNSLFDTPSKQSKDNLSRIRYLHRTRRYDLPNSYRPICQQEAHSYKAMYSRLRYDQPSRTITSGFGSPGQGRFIHPSQPRTLTPHEAARLQFFPDFFDFSAAQTRTSLAEMIGNAAPMKLSHVISDEMLTRFR
jgi:DNA (cytosine-5)-methyltransferase 1